MYFLLKNCLIITLGGPVNKLFITAIHVKSCLILIMWKIFSGLLCTCRALECDLIYQWCDKKKIWGPAVKKKNSLPVVQQPTTDTDWSKPIRDGEGRTLPLIGHGPDIPVRVCVRVLLQSDREVRCALCCQFSDFVVRFSNFSDPPSNFFLCRLASWKGELVMYS